MVTSREGTVVGMALLEPFRADAGRGALVSGWGHLSMLFVHLEWQRQGIGTELLARVVESVPWPNLSVWTRTTNGSAQATYRGAGFECIGEFGTTPGGEPTERWQRWGWQPCDTTNPRSLVGTGIRLLGWGGGRSDPLVQVSAGS